MPLAAMTNIFPEKIQGTLSKKLLSGEPPNIFRYRSLNYELTRGMDIF